jgi:glycosyltransferase involved in cell wall biosynthesis
MNSPTSLRRILLLSAYDAASHRQWRLNLEAMLPEYQWTQLALPARHFSWRLRGNGLSFAFEETEILDGDYDLLIVTSMVDLSTLRGFHPALAKLPTLVYFHENQFAYPERDTQRANAETQIVPLYAALCADTLAFNSDYNRHSFLAGAKTLLERLPDHVPRGLMNKLERAHTLPVPLAAPSVTNEQQDSEPTLTVIWNHRWEYDKGPALLLEFVRLLCSSKLNCALHIVGQQFKQRPAEFAEAEALLAAQARRFGRQPAHCGFIKDRADYEALLWRCDIVLSTALHDFQGLSVQEAALAGCSPLTPDDLVYPEYLPAANLYARETSEPRTAINILSRLEQWQRLKERGEPLPTVSLTGYTGAALAPRYRELFESTIAAHNAR